MPSSENTGYLVQLKSPEGENVYPIISAEMIKDKNGETYNLSELKEAVPSGIIVMWSGASDAIPSGWYLCDGQNGTPDLRNRFIVGAGSSYEVGNTGGSDSVTLTTEQMPSHTHGSSLTATSSGSHSHTMSGTTGSGGESESSGTIYGRDLDTGYSNETAEGYVQAGLTWTSSTGGRTLWTMSVGGSDHTHSFSGNTNSTGSHTHSISGSISNAGGGQSHENRPPYYALCFIMKA